MRIIDCYDFSLAFFSNLFIIFNVSSCRNFPPFKKGWTVVEAWDLKRDVTNEKGLERVRFAFCFSFLLSRCDIGQIILIE